MKKESLLERAKKQAQDSNRLIDKLIERNINELTEEELYSGYIAP